jgi:TonB family protein
MRRFVTDHEEATFMPHILAQLEDELARSRKREAFWISLFFHIAIVVAIATSPQWMQKFSAFRLRPAELETRQRETTFITLPKDTQKPPEKVETNKLSDKNRRAESRHPEIDRKTLEELRAQNALPVMPQPQVTPQQPLQQGQQGQQQGQPQSRPQPPPSQESAMAIPRENPFKAPGSAGDAIAQAARNGHPRFPGGGVTGIITAPSDRHQHRAGMEILSDTKGVDFGPYLARIHPIVQWNMYQTAPESVMPPLSKRGNVVIDFVIQRDGKIVGIDTVVSSGDVTLDRAAFATLTASSPLPPLPAEFPDRYLQIRGTFMYNPLPGE